jgi:hypothetical protein
VERDPIDNGVGNQVDCSLIAAQLPSFRAQWTVRRGIEELHDAYRQVGFTEKHLNGVQFQRYSHLQSLWDRGLVDADLRHTAAFTSPTSAASAPEA